MTTCPGQSCFVRLVRDPNFRYLTPNFEPSDSATPKSQNAIPATAAVGQGKMAAAGWYKRLTSLCTKLPTPCRGDRDRPVDENFILDGKHDGRMAGEVRRAVPFSGTVKALLWHSIRHFVPGSIPIHSAAIRLMPSRKPKTTGGNAAAKVDQN